MPARAGFEQLWRRQRLRSAHELTVDVLFVSVVLRVPKALWANPEEVRSSPLKPV